MFTAISVTLKNSIFKYKTVSKDNKANLKSCKKCRVMFGCCLEFGIAGNFLLREWDVKHAKSGDIYEKIAKILHV